MQASPGVLFPHTSQPILPRGRRVEPERWPMLSAVTLCAAERGRRLAAGCHMAQWPPTSRNSLMLTRSVRACGGSVRVRQTRHRHRQQWELYVLIEGRGRIRVDGDLVTLTPLSAILLEPSTIRQIFNDTDAAQLWLVVGAPRDPQMTPEELFPDGPEVLPPELGGFAER